MILHDIVTSVHAAACKVFHIAEAPGQMPLAPMI